MEESAPQGVANLCADCSGPGRLIIAGGGASGVFAAIAAAQLAPGVEVLLLERSSDFLSKVRISGGGRCNVTHACFSPTDLAKFYPRGGRALIGPLTRFGPTETLEWFSSRGVPLKTESDGRIFPATDSSRTIVDCLIGAAREAGVRLCTNRGVREIRRSTGGGFQLLLDDASQIDCAAVLWASGGAKTGSHPALALGHSVVAPVPSLFTFCSAAPWLQKLPGLAVETATLHVPGTSLRETGPVLLTHNGISGPAVLRLSAWGARMFHQMNYRFPLLVNWLGNTPEQLVLDTMRNLRESRGACLVRSHRWDNLPRRLWEALVSNAGIAPDTCWCRLPAKGASSLAKWLTACEIPVSGKSTNKEEFVTCGGIPLSEIHPATMESRVTPGLFFAGEALDIDGLTGGFNFQAAWTTGWLAGRAMARKIIDA